MSKEDSKEVFKLAYPRGSYDAQLPDRIVFQPADGDGWSQEEAEEFAREMATQIGIDYNEISLVNSYGKESELSLKDKPTTS